MKLVRLLANLGYGSRREVQAMLRTGVVTCASDGRKLGEKDDPLHADIRVNGEPLDAPAPLVIALHKPAGYVCTTEDTGDSVYELLPPRFARRNPGLNPVGRLDKETTGLLLLTDDGQFNHRVVSPKRGCAKIYRAELARPLEGGEGAVFASGDLMLRGEAKPCLPAELEVLSPHEALVTLHEGRYHQVRRMFAAVGNHVVGLRRVKVGGFALPEDLAEGSWLALTPEEVAAV